jgi:pseudouridine kinase
MTHEEHVLVIGAASIDTKGQTLHEIRPRTSTPGSIRASAGGVARNIAENLARLGETVVLLTAVGDDEPGRRILQQANQCGVDTSHVIVAQDRATAAYLAILDSSGHLVMSIDDMDIIRDSITAGYLNRRRRFFRDASMVVLDANVPASALRTAFRMIRSLGLSVCADPTSVSLAPVLRPYLPFLTLTTPNAAEAQALCGIRVSDRDSGLAAAHRLVGLGVRIAIVTLGPTGLVYATSNESGHVPAIEGEIVDLTGAGDALTAAVVFGLLNDLSVGEAVRLGASAAALTVQCRETVCPNLSLERLYDQLII